jgi:hypothetical protein
MFEDAGAATAEENEALYYTLIPPRVSSTDLEIIS